MTNPPPGRETLRHLVEYAVLAPSAGNAQPWCFEGSERGAHLRCWLDPARSGGSLDFERRASHTALGAALENIVLGAAELGLLTDVRGTQTECGDAQADVYFLAGGKPGLDAGLAAQIPQRATRRALGSGAPLPPTARRALEAEAAVHAGRLQWAEGQAAIDALGEVVGACDRIRMCHETLHAELMAEARWTPEAAASTGDGLDVRTMELSRGQLFLLKRLSKWQSVRALMRLGIERPFEEAGTATVRHASALALLTVRGTSPWDFVLGDRALQRIWLRASELDLGLLPLGVVPALFARLARDEGLAPGLRDRLTRQRERFTEVFQPAPDRAEVMLIALTDAPACAVRSARRPLDDVLRWTREP